MQRSQRGVTAVLLLAILVAGARADEKPKAAAKNSPDKNAPADAEATDSATIDQAALDKKFAESLSGVVFAGNYSVTSGGKETPAAMEKYTIARVSKVKEKTDLWLFETRIQYGKTDLPVPLILQVKWAGDTPVITLTELTIPALGTFTSRVMIYGERYAGTWQHGKTGGHLWGRIEKLEKPAAPPDGKTPGTASEGL
jgi:hypothetical protein